MARVEFRKVTKRYGDNTVIAGLDLTVRDGEFMVLVGPSGCGKSTALRMVAGLEEITSGEISIGDRVVNDLAPKDRDIAMVFQSYALYPHLTVRENMEFGLKIRKVPQAQIDRSVGEAAEVLGIAGLLDRRPKALSGGQRQRVALGRAIVRNPAVFLFDEPLSNLDAKLRVQMRAELSKLQRRLGTTTVYVTHDQVEAMTMGDRIAILEGGVLQQVGDPLEIYARPANTFVATFIGTPPMNLVQATVRGDRLVGDGFSLPTTAHLPTGLADGTGLVVGVRPEHLGIAPTDGTAPVETMVEVIEPLGHETLAHTRLGAELITAIVGPFTTARAEAPLVLHVALDQLHFFDAATGTRYPQAGEEVRHDGSIR
jgi:multiple sugar transport system ATP-binding protein